MSERYIQYLIIKKKIKSEDEYIPYSESYKARPRKTGSRKIKKISRKNYK